MRQVARKGILTAVATGSVLASTAGYAYASANADGVAAGSPGVGSGNAVQVPVDAPINVCGNTVDVVGLLNPAYGNQCGNSAPHGDQHSGHGGQKGGQPGAGDQGGSAAQTGPGTPQQGSWPGTPSMPGVPPLPGNPGGPVVNPPTGGDNGSTAGNGNGPTGNGPTGTAGSSASGVAAHSPGVGSGNTAQLPTDVPLNLCGNSGNVIGLLNPVMGNDCANHEVAPVVTPAPGPQAPPVQTPPTQSMPGGTTRTGGVPAAVPVAAPAAAPALTASHPATVGRLAYTGAGGIDVLAPAGLALLIAGGVLYRRSRAAA